MPAMAHLVPVGDVVGPFGPAARRRRIDCLAREVGKAGRRFATLAIGQPDAAFLKQGVIVPHTRRNGVVHQIDHHIGQQLVLGIDTEQVAILQV